MADIRLKQIAQDGATDKQIVTWNDSSSSYTVQDNISYLSFIIDEGQQISAGIKGDIAVPYNCVITEAVLLADQTGSITIDVWKDTYSNFPPDDSDSITASAPLTISSGIKYKDSTLTDWTKNISAGDILRFNVDSCTTIERISLVLIIKIR